jgi:SAM-dependent methyltransferase
MSEPRGAIPQNIDPAMAAHYARGVERGRLETTSIIEFERTKVILSQRLPRTGRVLDVGGGPGTYARWLADRGYTVELFDPIPLHVEQAREASRSGAPFQVDVGDARDLPVDDESADAVVMMGPLFHLVEREDRQLALREARRALRPGGAIVASAMGRFLVPFRGVVSNGIQEPDALEWVLSVAETGIRSSPPGPFPAYAHRPHELYQELSDAGFADVEVIAIEGFVHLLDNLHVRLNDQRSRDGLMNFLSRLESDPALVGVSGHIMALGRRL